MSINALLCLFLHLPRLKISQLHPMLPYEVLTYLAWLVIRSRSYDIINHKDARLDLIKGWEEETSSKLWLWTLRNVWTWTILESPIAWAVTFQGRWVIVQTTVMCFGVFLERISESTSHGHQIDRIKKLRSIRECLSTTHNGIFELTWFKLNNIWFCTSLGKPKWLNRRGVSINFRRWIRMEGNYLCRIRSNNRC